LHILSETCAQKGEKVEEKKGKKKENNEHAGMVCRASDPGKKRGGKVGEEKKTVILFPSRQHSERGKGLKGKKGKNTNLSLSRF